MTNGALIAVGTPLPWRVRRLLCRQPALRRRRRQRRRRHPALARRRRPRRHPALQPDAVTVPHPCAHAVTFSVALADTLPVPDATPTPTPTPSPTPSPAPTASPGTSTLNPLDDAYVAGELAGNNFGQTTDMQSDTSPLRESYMKFDLRPLAGLNISQATLRMFVTSGSANVQNIKQVADNSWTEGALTFSNRPVKGATVTTFTPGSTTGAYLQAPITSAVASGAGSFMSLAIDNAGSDGFTFNSAEAATNKVELVIQWSGGAPSTTPTPTPTPHRRRRPRREERLRRPAPPRRQPPHPEAALFSSPQQRWRTPPLQHRWWSRNRRAQSPETSSWHLSSSAPQPSRPRRRAGSKSPP